MGLSSSTDLDHATVAASETATHHRFERYEDRRACRTAETVYGVHHRRRPARVNRDVLPWTNRTERPSERDGDAPMLSARAILRRQLQRRSELLEERGVVQIARRSGPIEQRHRRRPFFERPSERREWREPDATRYHPRLSGPIDRHERLAERSENADSISSPCLVQLRRAPAHPFVEKADARRRAMRMSDDFEDRKRPAEQRVESA